MDVNKELKFLWKLQKKNWLGRVGGVGVGLGGQSGYKQ